MDQSVLDQSITRTGSINGPFAALEGSPSHCVQLIHEAMGAPKEIPLTKGGFLGRCAIHLQGEKFPHVTHWLNSRPVTFHRCAEGALYPLQAQ